MSIQDETRRYEDWLRNKCEVVEADLARKHKRMDKNAFVFLRATYYRWARKIETWCPKLFDAPQVLSIGDAHTENFGTWRDQEGRLVWGVNDFDEAAVMPYPLDLVRLAASATLAPERTLSEHKICTAIQLGYREGLSAPRPTLLDQQELWMRPFIACADDDLRQFWDELSKYPEATPPRNVIAGFGRNLPKESRLIRICNVVKGGGSLGRPRYLAVAEWRGGQVLREAKALVPSAWTWAHDRAPDSSAFLKAARGRFRSPDPCLDSDGLFIYRRIAADSRKIELGDDPGSRLRRDLLRAMGFDLGAIHAAHSTCVSEIENDLKERPTRWLDEATEKIAAAVREDYDDWVTHSALTNDARNMRDSQTVRQPSARF